MTIEDRYTFSEDSGEVFQECPNENWKERLDQWRPLARLWGAKYCGIATPMPEQHLMFRGKVGDLNGIYRRMNYVEAASRLATNKAYIGRMSEVIS